MSLFSEKSGLRLAPLWYLAGGLLLVGVAISSLIPIPDISLDVGDKNAHFLTYAGLACWFGLLVRRPFSLLWVIIGISAFGMLIELLQSMTTYRYGEWADVLANSIGVAVGIIFSFTPLRRILEYVDDSLARLLGR